MSSVLIEIFICLVIILLCYNCCARNTRDRDRDRDRGGDGDEDRRDGAELRRFRERLSARADAARNAEDGAGAAAERKELIEKNLFNRKIQREESVRELARLPAIARGGGAPDEELGGCHAAPVTASSGGDGGGAAESVDPPADLPRDPTLSTTDASESSESSLPVPAAPQAAGVPTTTTTTTTTTAAAAATTTTTPSTTMTIDTIAAALSSQPPNPPPSNNPPLLHPMTLEPIRNLLNNLSYTLQSGSERGALRGDEKEPEWEASSAGGCPPISRKNGILDTGHKLECSICLDAYSPGDTICWAKDGGDAATLSTATVSVNSGMGCDHIFHKDCIAAWLQDHDECPLCRRKVVHADADARFAAWGM